MFWKNTEFLLKQIFHVVEKFNNLVKFFVYISENLLQFLTVNISLLQTFSYNKSKLHTDRFAVDFEKIIEMQKKFFLQRSIYSMAKNCSIIPHLICVIWGRAVGMFLWLTSNIFHILIYCFHCWLWTNKWRQLKIIINFDQNKVHDPD